MEQLINHIKKKFPCHDVIPLTGGGTNALYLLGKADDQTVLKIAMLSKEKAIIEELCLLQLKDSKLVPRLYEKLLIDNRTALHMEYIKGKSILSLILEYHNSSESYKTTHLFTSMGELISRIHNIRLDFDSNLPTIRFNEPPIKSFIDRSLYNHSLERISCLENCEQETTLIHGDFGYHNVILELSGSYKLIDWELAGVGDPRVDIANVLFWTHLHFPDKANKLGLAFLNTYLNHTSVNCSEEILHSIIIFQIWRIIEMVDDNFPQHVKDEWNRRLMWALDHRFI